jgi:hypothetical protein
LAQSGNNCPPTLIIRAYQKVKDAIPASKENAISFDSESLWIEAHPTNPRRAKTIRFERDFDELDVKPDESDCMG